MVKKILLALALILVVIQFFGIDKEVPETDPSQDFLIVAAPAAPVAILIENSYKTEYPWYANVAPLSWWLQDHVNHGREELNFSTWTEYSPNRADHKLEEAAEYIETEEMPLPSFTWTHPEARLTNEQRELMVTWFEDYRTQIRIPLPENEEGAENEETDHQN